MQTKRHYEGTNFITGLRAIAIFLVFLIHSGGGGLRELGGAYNLLVDFGQYGVPMFFVISGFTIFYQLDSGRYSFSEFLMIRVSRVSIPYFPLILLIFIYSSMGGEQFNGWANKFNDGVISIDNMLAHLTYLASFSLKYANTIIGVEWSLHIEVFFYLILGYAIARKFLKISFKSLFVALLATVIMAIIFLFLRHTNRLDPLLVNFMPFRYAWMFVLGGIGYYCRNVVHRQLTKEVQYKLSNIAILVSIASALTLLNVKEINGVGAVNEGVFALLTFIMIAFVRDDAGLSAMLKNKVLIWFGSISFSFYLIHYIVIQTKIVHYFVADTFLLFIANFLLATLISYLWFSIFEVKIYRKAKLYITSVGRD